MGYLVFNLEETRYSGHVLGEFVALEDPAPPCITQTAQIIQWELFTP